MKNKLLFITMIITMIITLILSLVIIIIPLKLIAISILFLCFLVVVLSVFYYRY